MGNMMIASDRFNMIITCSKLITCNPNLPPIDEGTVAIRNGIIKSVETPEKIKKLFPRDAIIRIPRSVLLPGLINLHTHIELPPLLHSIRAKTFSEWVLNLIHKKRILSQKDYETAAINNIETLIET